MSYVNTCACGFQSMAKWVIVAILLKKNKLFNELMSSVTCYTRHEMCLASVQAGYKESSPSTLNVQL